MATINTIKVDIIQETIHDQIKKLTETVYEQSGVKLEDIRISWYDYLGVPSYITEIKIETTKRN